jgi:hypothetical protein
MNVTPFRHCEERSDAAIQGPAFHGLPRYARSDANKTVIANKVKQSMTFEYMDCHATLAVTRTDSR